MVWVLSHESASAALVASKYHFTSPGTYKVGRRDCHVNLQTDRTVSRLHAEIIISPVTLLLPIDNSIDVPAPQLLLKDHSKFGTFVGQATGAKPVFSSSDRVVSLKDGDLITFGTGNSTFRFSYIPMVLCVSLLVNEVKESTQKNAASMGAYVINAWSKSCTHLVVKEGSKVNDDIFSTVIYKKIVIELSWVEAMITRNAPSDDLPAMSSFLPTLMFEGHEGQTPVKISEPNVRELVFQGFIFLIGPSDLYRYGKYMQHLLEAASGVVQNISRKSDISKELYTSGKQYVLVVPDGAAENQSWIVATAIRHQLNTANESKLVQVVLTGQKEILSTFLITRSAGGRATSISTEETMEVVDSEEDINSAAPKNEDVNKIATSTISNVAVGSIKKSFSLAQKQAGSTNESNIEIDNVKESQLKFQQIFNQKAATISKQTQPRGIVHTPVVDEDTQPFKLLKVKRVEQPSEVVSPLDSKLKYIASQIEEASNVDTSTNIDPSIEADVQYSCLIVQKDWNKGLSESEKEGSAPNFKLFKKFAGLSGNSFTELVPFAKEPYRDSDYGREVEEYMQREKKRKDVERLAEDLFNAERLKRQRATLGESLKDSVGIRSTLKGKIGFSRN